jgi:hypothetical protein
MSPDTITIKADWPLKSCVKLLPNSFLPMGRHVKLFIDSTGTLIRKVACNSLAALFFGHGGRLFVHQGEYDEALDLLAKMLAAVAVAPPIEDWQLSRLDIAFHLDLRARPLIMAHELLRIPGIRKGPTIFDDGHGISWRGDGSKFVVRLYDKARKMHVTGSVLRAEISLCGKHLENRLKGGEWRELEALWRVFRGIMITIPSFQRPRAAKNWQEALGSFPKEVRILFLAQMEPHVAARTFRLYRARTEAAARAAELETFSWVEELKPHKPTEAIHVKPRTPEMKKVLNHSKQR